MASIELFDKETIKQKIGIDVNGDGQKFFTNTCYNHMDKYVPKDTGNLRRVVTISPNSITYEMPYAEYQYRGMRADGTRVVTNYTTPGTGSYWDEKMVTAEGDEVVKELQRFVNRRLK